MEQKIKNGTKIKEIETGEIYAICLAIQTNNQWGYGIYLYQFEETIKDRPSFELYRKEFEVF